MFFQGLVRLLLPIVHDQHERLVIELSQLLKADVSVGGIGLHWNYFVPYLDLLDVSIQQVEGEKQAQKLQRLSIGFNILNMLRAGSFFPSNLKIDGLNIILAKTREGQYYFPGLKLLQKRDKSLWIKWESLLSYKNVELTNANFIWHHEGQNTQLDFADIELNFASNGSRYNGLLKLRPPRHLAAEIQIAFNLRGT